MIGGYKIHGTIRLLRRPYHDSLECTVKDEDGTIWFQAVLWIGWETPGLIVMADSTFCPNVITAKRFAEAYEQCAKIIYDLKAKYDAAEDKKDVDGTIVEVEL